MTWSSAGSSYTLAAGTSVEALSTITWEATTAINLTGNEIANALYGNAGANMLDGGGGDDVMHGFGGDDYYVVDSAGDQAIEVAGQGYDVVFARTSYTLAAGTSVEALSTITWEATGAINLTGNELANALYGNAGANVLDGKGGTDVLEGFGGAGHVRLHHRARRRQCRHHRRLQPRGVDMIALDDAVFTGLASGALDRPRSSPAPRPRTPTTGSSTTARPASSSTTPTAPAPAPRSSSPRCQAGLALTASDFMVI